MASEQYDPDKAPAEVVPIQPAVVQRDPVEPIRAEPVTAEPVTAEPMRAAPITAGPAEVPQPQPLAQQPQPARRRGRFLLVLAIVVGSVLLVGGIAGVVLYDQATKIDRSTPTVVAGQFLQAALVEEDIDQVGLFVCRAWSAKEALAAADVDLDSDIIVSWGGTTERIAGGKAQVLVRVTFSLSEGGTAQRSIETWTLETVREDGWRVCALQRGASLGP